MVEPGYQPKHGTHFSVVAKAQENWFALGKPPLSWGKPEASEYVLVQSLDQGLGFGGPMVAVSSSETARGSTEPATGGE